MCYFKSAFDLNEFVHRLQVTFWVEVVRLGTELNCGPSLVKPLHFASKRTCAPESELSSSAVGSASFPVTFDASLFRSSLISSRLFLYTFLISSYLCLSLLSSVSLASLSFVEPSISLDLAGTRRLNENHIGNLSDRNQREWFQLRIRANDTCFWV